MTHADLTYLIFNCTHAKPPHLHKKAMITHNPREVLVHRCLMGECLTPAEKNMLNVLRDRKYCAKPATHSNIDRALKGLKFRKVKWQDWINDNDTDMMTVSPVSFCRVNPEHLFIKELQNNGTGDERLYDGCVYVSDKLFKMAADEKDDAAGITVGFSRLL